MNRRNRWMAVALALLATLTLLVEQPWRGDAHRRTAETIRPLFPALQKDVPLGAVRVRPAGAAPIHVEKVLDRGRPRWVVREAFDHPADLRQLGRVVDSLRALETRNVEAVEESSHATFQVTEEAATRVRIQAEDGRPLADLLIGGMRSQDPLSGQAPVLQFYVRAADSPIVYRTDALTIPADEPAEWCDTRFLSGLEGPGTVRWFQRTDEVGGESWRVVRARETGEEEQLERAQAADEPGIASGRWRMVQPLSAPTPDFAADSWLFTMLGLRAEAVLGLAADPRGQELFGESTDVLALGTEDAGFRIELGALVGDELRAARVPGLPHLYGLAAFDVEQLLQPVESMSVGQ